MQTMNVLRCGLTRLVHTTILKRPTTTIAYHSVCEALRILFISGVDLVRYWKETSWLTVKLISNLDVSSFNPFFYYYLSKCVRLSIMYFRLQKMLRGALYVSLTWMLEKYKGLKMPLKTHTGLSFSWVLNQRTSTLSNIFLLCFQSIHCVIYLPRQMVPSDGDCYRRWSTSVG